MPTLANTKASFTFTADGVTGLKLDTFTRAGSGITWTNSDNQMWRAHIFDTTAASPFNTTLLTPTAATFGGATIVATPTQQSMTLTWTAVPAGTGTLTVSMTVTLKIAEDFLRTRIAASWASAGTMALDDLACLPLQINPLNAPNDVACFGTVRGITSTDPMTNLRFNPGGGRPNTLFNGLAHVQMNYPTGRGWNMAVWGYYDPVVAKEGWMTWLEDWSQELIQVTFEADGTGTHLIYEPFQPQPNSVVIGNGGSALGSLYTYGLRPFKTSQQYGWWDVASFYRGRYDAAASTFVDYTPIRTQRSDLSAAEKRYSIFLDFNFPPQTLNVGDGKPANILKMIRQARANSGAPASTQVWTMFEASAFGLEYVGEDRTNDLPVILKQLANDETVFPTLWVPDSGTVEGRQATGPSAYSIYRWNKDAIGDKADLRYWQTNDVQGAQRMSRRGFLEGGGSDRLSEQVGSPDYYYRERTYPITNWNPSTKVLTVTGAPSGDGFSSHQKLAVVIPPSTSNRMGLAVVSSLGASSITVNTLFAGGDGSTITPDATYTVVVLEDVGSSFLCAYPQLYATQYRNRLINNTEGGTQVNLGMTGLYWDTFSDPSMTILQSASKFCFRDHSGWSQLDAGYVNHPKGGGAWHKQAWRGLFKSKRVAVKSLQASQGKRQFATMTCEYMDEQAHDCFDISFGIVGSGDSWRVTDGFDPTIHKYLAVPMYAVAHSGRTYARALNQEFSSGTLVNAFPYNDPVFHRMQAFDLASEWVYGLTLPTLSFFTDGSSIPALQDFWDETQYQLNGGPISNTVRSIRDLWSQIVSAEANWLCAKGFRFGKLQAPATLDPALTDFTTGQSGDGGFAGNPYGSGYTSYDVVYARAQFPRVVAALWSAADGSARLCMVNWTDTAAKWGGTIDSATAGLGAPGSSKLLGVSVRRLDSTQNPTGAFVWNASTAKFSIPSLAPYTITVAEFTLPVDRGTVPQDPPDGPCSGSTGLP